VGLVAAAEQVCARVGARAHLLGRDLRVAGAPDDFAVTLELDDGRQARGGEGKTRSSDREVERLDGLTVPTQAGYQVVNAALAVAGCRLLLGPLDEAAVRGALARAAVPGRLQVAGRDPLLIADGAHNPDGVRALAGALEAIARPSPRVGVAAIMADKAVGEMLDVLAPLLDVLVCTEASETRSLPAVGLAAKAREAGKGRLRIEIEPDPHRAVAIAQGLAGTAGSVLVTGSLYLLADLADLLEA